MAEDLEQKGAQHDPSGPPSLGELSAMTRLVVELTGSNDAFDSRQAESFVQAWARDIATGEPRYILELGRERNGAKSACDCPSCELPLLAINAGRDTWRRRPHFRHPRGADAKSCIVLTARLVALQALKDLGTLQLPSRRVGASFLGLSGRYHHATVNAPAESVHIRDVLFDDPGNATLLLADGRRLQVRLMGSSGAAEDTIVPTIRILVDDQSIMSMDPAEVRRRLSLNLDEQCWMSHWQDEALQRAAQEEASRQAEDCCDVCVRGTRLDDA